MPRKYTSSDPISRFWPKVDRSNGFFACWIWIAGKTGEGYGGFGHATLAHRFAYELLIGPIPTGLILDHLCRNRACVNPLHLEPVSILVNLQRGIGTLGSWQMQKPHCPQGHLYDEVNTYRSPRGERRCRTCHRKPWRK